MTRMWKEIWEHHKGKLTGVASGLFFGTVYLLWGFFDMLVVLCIVLVGFFAGARADRKETAIPVHEIYRWLTDKWRMFR